MVAFTEIEKALGNHGLIARGGFTFENQNDAPRDSDGNPARFIILVGFAGQAMWPHFSTWCSLQNPLPADPLDTWSKHILSEIAERFRARAVFPSDKPWLPFQQWAVTAEALKPSPLGILMHEDYGLWHAYRGALLFDKIVELPARDPGIHHCDNCVDKPCLPACPVDAFANGQFAVERCRAHVLSSEGRQCREQGCLARNACPIATKFRYSPDQQAFHTEAFLKG